eukprot:m.82468 g.82468  ORF g.82468 m.82468 type:complete len:226 (+) comp16339_c0_seq2:229-906(+)
MTELVIKMAEERSAKTTYFTGIRHPFKDVGVEDSGTPALDFLDACADLVPFFDLLGSKAFYPVKRDINGNIKKLRNLHAKYTAEATTAHSTYNSGTLQSMISIEIDSGTTNASGSATDALLWLKRALSFIRVFLQCLLDGERHIKKAANVAYAATLQKYHGFMVKKIFSMAMMAVPSWEGFMESVRMDSTDADDVLLEQIADFVSSFSTHLERIDAFYADKNLDS